MTIADLANQNIQAAIKLCERAAWNYSVGCLQVGNIAPLQNLMVRDAIKDAAYNMNTTYSTERKLLEQFKKTTG
jgi:hypothetical protein